MSQSRGEAAVSRVFIASEIAWLCGTPTVAKSREHREFRACLSRRSAVTSVPHSTLRLVTAAEQRVLRERAVAWVERTCAEQGVPVKLSEAAHYPWYASRGLLHLGSQTYSQPVEPEEFISQSAWEKLSHQEQDAYYERFSESLRAVLQGRNSDRALLFADHWDDLASWTRSAWNVMLENADQLEARLEELATSPELSEADRSWAAESLDKARAMREHMREAEDL